jgi:hypothetical protein
LKFIANKTQGISQGKKKEAVAPLKSPSRSSSDLCFLKPIIHGRNAPGSASCSFFVRIRLLLHRTCNNSQYYRGDEQSLSTSLSSKIPLDLFLVWIKLCVSMGHRFALGKEVEFDNVLMNTHTDLLLRTWY